MPPPTKAIITIATGQGYIERWRRWSEPNWRAYAQRHGYDIILHTEPLDRSERARRRSPAWQKCLILNDQAVSRYERVVWLDADIIVNPLAPDVSHGVPPALVGATDEHAFPSMEARLVFIQSQIDGAARAGQHTLAQLWTHYLTPDAYHRSWGLPGGTGNIVQTGVMVLSPEHHRDILQHVYHAYEDKGGNDWNYEMRPLSFELQKAAQVHWIDPRFNTLVEMLVAQMLVLGGSAVRDPLNFLRETFQRNFMLHFAGAPANMDSLPPLPMWATAAPLD